MNTTQPGLPLHEYLGITKAEAHEAVARAGQAGSGLIKKAMTEDPNLTQWAPRSEEDPAGATTLKVTTSLTKGRIAHVFQGSSPSKTFDPETLQPTNQ